MAHAITKWWQEKTHQKGCSCKGRRTKKGGFVNEAIVPFGLFALQKRTQGKRGHNSAKHAKSFIRSRKTDVLLSVKF
jgi:hypothetical protein